MENNEDLFNDEFFWEDEDENEEKFPIDAKRFEIKGLSGRSQYVIIDNQGIMITFPDNLQKNHNYQATATALSRIISIAQQAGIGMNGIKKQLEESSMQKHDTPYVLLEAINKYEIIIGEKNDI